MAVINESEEDKMRKMTIGEAIVAAEDRADYQGFPEIEVITAEQVAQALKSPAPEKNPKPARTDQDG